MQINKPRHVWQLSFEGSWPTSVAFLGNHRRIAAGNRAGTVLVWRLPEAPPKSENGGLTKNDNGDANRPPDSVPARTLVGHVNGITHLRTIDDGKTLISASLDHTVRIWNPDATASGKQNVVIDLHRREKLAKRKKDEERKKILEAPGVEVDRVGASHVLKAHGGWVNGLDASQDGKRIITGDDQCLTVVWDLASRKQISNWHGYDRVWIRSASLSPDGKTAFTCEYAGRRSNFDAPAAQARLWNADDGTVKLDLLKTWTPDVKDDDRKDTYGYWQKWNKLLKRGLVCAQFSLDGRLLAVGQGGETDTGRVHLIDVASGKILRTVSGHRYGVCDVKFSADGRYVLSCGRDTTARICQVTDGKEVAVLGKQRGGQFKDWIHAIAISPDQQYVAGADIAGSVHVWQLKS